MEVRGDQSRDEVESFLENETIPVRIGCRTPSEGLWMLSLWFLYRDGRLHCATSKQADVVTYLDHDSCVAFEVSTNHPPYKGVRGRGTASVADDPEKELLRELLDRYLGTTDSSTGRRLLTENRDEVSIAIDPQHVFGWDFTDQMQDDGG
jgi:nitroimidazol reductase NimA-like FMN-containing flavoprotein (pyridoxamine 5'-phosphate oxidase superfamily)